MGQEVTSVALYLLVGIAAELAGWAGGIATVVGLSALACLWFTLRAESEPSQAQGTTGPS